MKRIVLAILTTSYASPSSQFSYCWDDFDKPVHQQPAYDGPVSAIHLEIATTLLNQPGKPAAANAHDVAIAMRQ